MHVLYLAVPFLLPKLFCLVSILHEVIVHKSVFIPLSNKESSMYAYARSWLANNGDRNQQNNNFRAHFFYKMFLLVHK